MSKRVYNRLWFGLLLLTVFVLVAGVLGCSKPATPTSQAPAKTTAASQAPAKTTAPASVITLKAASGFPATHVAQKWFAWSCNQTQEKTGGRVRFEIYPAGQLVSEKETHTALLQGTVDMTVQAFGYVMDLVPESNLAYLPFAWNDAWGLKAAFDAGFANIVSQKWEKLGVKVLGYQTWGEMNIFGNKQVILPKDFGGLVFRSNPGYIESMIKLIGAKPTNITAPEVYGAFQKGMLDVGFTSNGTFMSTGLRDVVKYFLQCRFSTGLGLYNISMAKWNALPPDVQKIMQDSFNEGINNCYKEVAQIDNEGILAHLKEKGVNVHTLTPEELTTWRTAVAPIWDQAIKDFGDTGKKAIEIIKATNK